MWWALFSLMCLSTRGNMLRWDVCGSIETCSDRRLKWGQSLATCACCNVGSMREQSCLVVSTQSSHDAACWEKCTRMKSSSAGRLRMAGSSRSCAFRDGARTPEQSFFDGRLSCVRATSLFRPTKPNIPCQQSPYLAEMNAVQRLRGGRRNPWDLKPTQPIRPYYPPVCRVPSNREWKKMQEIEEQ